MGGWISKRRGGRRRIAEEAGKGEKKKNRGIYASANNLLLSLKKDLLLMFVKMSTLGLSGLP